MLLLRVYLGFLLAFWQGGSSLRLNSDQIAFIKEGQLFVSHASDLSVKQLTNDTTLKQTPRWSPDGRRIVYWEVAQPPTSLGNLVVVRSDGTLVGRYSVATVTPDGIQIGGMRWIETIGWFSNDDVFAAGSVNPHADEYRIISTKSKQQLRGFGGFDFSTCSSAGLVAFWAPVFPPSTQMRLVTSISDRSRYDIPNYNDLPSLQVPITWDDLCKYFAFVDARTPARLVVIATSGAKKVMELPAGYASAKIEATDGGFVVEGPKALSYDTRTDRLGELPTSTADQLKEADQLRQHVALELNASQCDWWPARGR